MGKDNTKMTHMCHECGTETTSKISLSQHMDFVHNEDFEIGVEYDHLLETIGGSREKPDRCDLCHRSPPGYVEFADINGETVCGRCLKRLGEEVDKDRVNKWETEELVPKNL